MNLKFTFSEGPNSGDLAQPPQEGAAVGRPLPFSLAPASGSSVLELHVRRDGGAVIAEARSGDGVTYSSGSVGENEFAHEPSIADLARSIRSALSRAVAGLEGPLSESVTAIRLNLGEAGPAALRELGLKVQESAEQLATVDEALQRRIGVTAGTPILRGDTWRP